MTDGADPSLDVVKARVRIEVSYDGTDFFGWAAQPGRRTVQAELEAAIATVLRLPMVSLIVAGRTDSGVHARGQVAHADLPRVPLPNVLTRLAGLLPRDVRVLSISHVPAEFDARFSALWRRYEYRISDRAIGVEPLRRRFVLDHRRALDVAAMAAASTGLLGLHDYAAFCRRRAFGTTIRRVQHFEVSREGSEVVCTVQADAFCHSMVRALVGALIAVGDGTRAPGWPASLLSRAARADEVSVAPALGLTLVEVGYPPDHELAARKAETRARR